MMKVSLIYRIQHFILRNKKQILYHLIGWVLFWIIELGYGYSIEIKNINLFKFGINATFFLTCFYSILNVCFLTKSTWKSIFLKSIALILILFLLKYFLDVYISKTSLFVQFGENYLIKFLIFEFWRITQATLYAYAYWIYLNSLKEQKQRREAEKKLLKTEIDFLKAQINPHFVFNTLNFVYNKVASIDKESGEAIMSLTRLMRNSVESTKHEQATIASEVNMIEEYLYLQKLRFGNRLCVEFKKEGLFSFFAIPPLILISLVENAFKYGIIDDAENPIYISIKVDKDALYFVCKNKKRVDFEDKETTAIGLGNIKRRLEIYYDHNYDLYANETIDIYEVFLNIRWKK